MSTREISRRTFVAGLGAVALGLRSQPVAALTTADAAPADAGFRIIDSAVDLSRRAEAIRLAGIETVIRYYAHGPGQWDGKVLSRPELDALEAQNLSVAVVFQHGNNDPDSFFSDSKASADIMWARTHADHLQQPEGTPIYFGADFDLRHWDGKRSDPAVTAQRAGALRRYFEHMRVALARDGRKLGVYGCGATCELMEGIADYFWLSASPDYLRSAEYYNSRKWHLYQNRVDLTRHFGDPRPCPIDTNLANPDRAAFGQWRRSGNVEHAAPDTARAILGARSFVTVQKLGLYRDRPAHDATPVDPESLTEGERAALRYALNIRIVTEDDAYYGISLDEGDTVGAYCHKSDLCPVGLMPLRGGRTGAPKSAAFAPAAPLTYGVAGTGESVPLPRSRPRR